MFYVVCAYIALGVIGFIFLPTHIPETNLEKLQRQRMEKKERERKEMEDIEKWSNNV